MSSGAFDPAENRRPTLTWAALLVEGFAVQLSIVSSMLAMVLPRHPLFYRTNQLQRQIEELGAELRRESDR